MPDAWQLANLGLFALLAITAGVALTARFHDVLRDLRRPFYTLIVVLTVGYVAFGAYYTGMPRAIDQFRLFFLLFVGFCALIIMSFAAGAVVITFVLSPSRVRRFLAVIAFIGAAMVSLSACNTYYRWGWNFPDILGVVFGTIAMGFFLYDRYLASQKSSSANSRR